MKTQIKQYIKMFCQNMVLPLWYKLARNKKVIPGLVVFADAHHTSRPRNMDVLYDRLSENRSYKIIESYLDYGNASFLEVTRHMLGFMKLYARAEYVILCDNFLPAASCRKRKETKVIQLWHGCGAFKKFGYATEDDIPKSYHGNVFSNTDLIPVTAEKCRKPLADAMLLPVSSALPLGSSRTDLYFDVEWRAQCRLDFYRKYPQARDKKILLWAPTFRGKVGDPILLNLDLKKLSAALGDEWFVLCKVHPHMEKKYAKVNCPIPTEDLFPVVDVLVADYSSLIVDYLFFDKPLLLYVPDLAQFGGIRGFFFPYDELPGVRVQKEEELSAAVLDIWKKRHLCTRNSDPDRARYWEWYMSACDGHSTDRIIEWMQRNKIR